MEGGTGNPKEYMLIPPSALGITSIVDTGSVDTTFSFSHPYSFGQPYFYVITMDRNTHLFSSLQEMYPPEVVSSRPAYINAHKHFHFAATTEADLQKVMS